MIFIYLYLIFLYIRPQDWVPAFYGFPTAMTVIPMGLLAGFLRKQQNPDLYILPQTTLVPYYLIMILVGTTIAAGFATALSEFIEFLLRGMVFFMVVWNVDTPKRLKSVINFTIGLTLFLAYQGVMQGETGQCWGGMTVFPGYEEIRIRWYGDWDGPNVLGILFVVGIALMLEYAFGPWKQHGLITRLLALAAIGYAGQAMFFTNSRGAILATLVGILFFFRKEFVKPYFLVLGTVVLIGAIAAMPSRMTEVNSEEESAHERIQLWDNGINMLRAHPLTGVGKGQFSKHSKLRLIAHNNYVQNFGESGFPGYYIFMALLWYSIWYNMTMDRPEYNVPDEVCGAGRMMVAAFIGYMASTFFVVMENDLLFYFFGLAAATQVTALNCSKDFPRPQFTAWDRNIIIAIMMSILGVIIVQVYFKPV